MAAHPKPEFQGVLVSLGGTLSAGETFYWANDTGHPTVIAATNPNSYWPLTQNSYGPILRGATQAATIKDKALAGSYLYDYSDETEQATKGVGQIIIR